MSARRRDAELEELLQRVKKHRQQMKRLAMQNEQIIEATEALLKRRELRKRQGVDGE